MMGFSQPVLILGLLLSAGYASLYHLWGGRTVRDLFLYLVVAGIGFFVGQAIGNITDIGLLQIGHLHLLEASLTAWMALIGLQLLARPARLK